MLRDIQDEILKLKKEKDVCVLAHSYLSHDICEIADFVGDSFALSKKAAQAPNKNVLMCGVKFMAETVKLLSPEKRVYISDSCAGCPMAEQMTPQELADIKKAEPDRKVVAYINTTAALKELCDVCVTSSSALKIVSEMDDKKILFIPDCNLGGYIKDNVKDKDIMLINGGCPIHNRVTAKDVEEARKLHPNALLLVHPECKPEVVKLADYVGSTAGIMDFAKESDEKEFIIGTENSIVEHLRFDCPDKKFYPLSKELICSDMKLTTITGVLSVLKSIGETDENEILMTDEQIKKARVCIDEMLKRG
ncbi:MAG: quinolinate synthase NadA [Oscillospiraceae bacterium]|nr:quinolinate synthase NadA [Oscillospiraceae bacterium]